MFQILHQNRHGRSGIRIFLHLCIVKQLFSAIALLLFWGFSAWAGEPYFCTQQGRTLFYERRDAASGKLERTTTWVIGEVHDEGGRTRVDYTFGLNKPNGAPMYGGPSEMSVLVERDGDVRMDVSGTMKAVFANMFPNAEIVSTGELTLLPANMRPGDVLPDARSVVTVRGIKYRTEVTERQVLREERITVPAGTFDCVVVREHKVERGPGRNRTTTGDTWYAPGIGYVRHDTYDKNLRLETTEVLKKY